MIVLLHEWIINLMVCIKAWLLDLDYYLGYKKLF